MKKISGRTLARRLSASKHWTFLCAATLACTVHPAMAQVEAASGTQGETETAAALIPDAPSFTRVAALASETRFSTSAAPDALASPGAVAGSSEAFGQTPRTPGVAPEAGVHDKYILPGQVAPRLTFTNKTLLGIKDAVSPFSAAGWVISAGYAQATNGSPNYGQTGKGFAQRLGAAAARSTSEGVFSDSILSPILHEDPRYYKMGDQHFFIKRLFYAGTRTILTRTDGGKQTINFGLLGGNLAGAALTQAYYPTLNRGFDETAKTFAGSIGGSALGFVVSEFLADTLQTLHLKKPQ